MTPPDPGTERLILLLAEHQEALFRYVFSLVPHEADARDILQETQVALFRKFGLYDPARPFLPWAYRFAYLEVQKHREKAARSRLLFSDDVLDLLADERGRLAHHLDERLRWLDHCLRALSPLQKELVTARYGLRHGADELMRRFSMSRRTLFRNLELLRGQLHECVTRHMGREAVS